MKDRQTESNNQSGTVDTQEDRHNSQIHGTQSQHHTQVIIKKRTTSGGRVTSLVVSVLWRFLFFFIFCFHCFRRRFFGRIRLMLRRMNETNRKKLVVRARARISIYKAPTANKRITIYDSPLLLRIIVEGVRPLWQMRCVNRFVCESTLRPKIEKETICDDL